MLGSFSYFQIRRAEYEQLVKGYREKLSADLDAIDRNAEDSLRILQYLSKNSILERVLLDAYPNYVLANKAVIENLETYYWVLTTSSRSNINELKIYSFKDIPNTGNFIYGNYYAEGEEWYQELNKTKNQMIYVKDGQIWMVYPVFRSKFGQLIGAIKVRIDMDNFLQSIWDYDAFEFYLGEQLIANTSASGERDGVLVEVSSEKTAFHLVYQVKKPSFFGAVFIMLLLVILSGGLTIITTLLYSKRLECEYTRLREEEQKASYFERLLLKSQISPHFLYNIMSMINWKAKFSGNEEISEICVELSDFYRTALNKGIEEISVKEELKNIQAYIQLKLRMVETPFSYSIRCPEELEDAVIINFILQPIVENAILHGMGSREEGGGLIDIRVELEARKDGGADLLFIVEDNGTIDFDMDEIWSLGKGYGLKNVHERIYHRYGLPYGIALSRAQGISRVVLRLPRAAAQAKN